MPPCRGGWDGEVVILEAGPEVLTDLAEFLELFAALVWRAESRHALERYTKGEFLCRTV